jgi:lipoate-protein ligase A
MATDHAIMEAVGDGRVAPTLRFYAWQPYCLSLGYAQKVGDVDFAALQRLAWDVVRRPTGGRAILHGDELTYSITLPQEHPLAQGDILASYHRISQALQAGLALLGANTQTAPYERHHAPSPVCFETPSAYEITANGKKLIGSAQVRRQKAVLQHGTLPLWGDVGRICQALSYRDEEERQQAQIAVRARATTLETVLGYRVEWEAVAQALSDAFAQTFELDLQEAPLTPAEALRIEQVRKDVYANDVWNQQR